MGVLKKEVNEEMPAPPSFAIVALAGGSILLFVSIGRFLVLIGEQFAQALVHE